MIHSFDLDYGLSVYSFKIITSINLNEIILESLNAWSQMQMVIIQFHLYIRGVNRRASTKQDLMENWIVWPRISNSTIDLSDMKVPFNPRHEAKAPFKIFLEKYH